MEERVAASHLAGDAAEQRNVWWDEQTVCQHCIGGGSRTGLVFAGGIQSPEAHGRTEGFPQRMAQATWSSPASNRLLLEASLGLGPDIQFGGLQKNPYDKTLIRVTDQGGAIPNLAYRAAFWSRPRGLTRVAQGSLSYVTGSHNAKFGGRYHYNDSLGVNFYNDSQLSYTFLNGSPTQLTMFGNHDVRQLVTQGMASLYAQDQWTRGRLTLQGGVRFEHLSAEFPTSRSVRTCSYPSASHSPLGTAESASRTSCRAWAPPTICLATEGRQSRCLSAAT